MPERMTPAELDAAEALAAAATEGPWRKHDIGGSGAQEPESIVVHTGHFDWEALQDGETSVAWMPRWDSQEDADAEFIAAARSLVPRLVAEVRARDEVIKAVRGLVDDWQGNGNSCELGDPTAGTWHKCARQLLRALDGAPDE